MKKLIVASVMTGTIIAGGFLQHSANKQLIAVLDHQIATTQAESGIEICYDQASISLFTGEVQVSNLSIHDPAIAQTVSIEHLSLQNSDADANLLSLNGKFHAIQVKFETEQGEPIAEARTIRIEGDGDSTHYTVVMEDIALANDFGFMCLPESLQNTRYDLASSIIYDEQSQAVDMQLTVSANHIANMNVGLSIANSGELMALFHQFEQQPLAMQNMHMVDFESEVALLSLQLQPKTFNLSLNNEGGLAALARPNGEPSFWLAQAQKVLDYNILSDDNAEALDRFVNGLRSLSIQVTSEQQMSLAELSGRLLYATDTQSLSKLLSLHIQGQ